QRNRPSHVRRPFTVAGTPHRHGLRCDRACPARHEPDARTARQAVPGDGRANAFRPPSLSPQTGSSRMSLYFTKEHEWIRVDGDVATVGISDHAQEALGDIVFAEVPDAGRSLAKGDDAAVVESVKAASDVYAPVGGEVIEGNSALA